MFIEKSHFPHTFQYKGFFFPPLWWHKIELTIFSALWRYHFNSVWLVFVLTKEQLLVWCLQSFLFAFILFAVLSAGFHYQVCTFRFLTILLGIHWASWFWFAPFINSLCFQIYTIAHSYFLLVFSISHMLDLGIIHTF